MIAMPNLSTLSCVLQVGYGNTALVTNSELWYGTLAMILGASMYAYMVGSLLDFFSLSDAEASRRATLSDINSLMCSIGVPRPLTLRVRKFFAKSAATESILLEDYRVPLAKLSPRLASQLARHMHQEWLARPSAWWLRTYDTSLTLKLALVIKSKSCSPMECVLRAEDASNDMWVVLTGWVYRVKAKVDQRNLPLMNASRVPTKSTFGEEIACSRPIPYGYAVFTASYCEFFRLERSDLDELLPYYPALRARRAWAAIVLLIKRHGGAKLLLRLHRKRHGGRQLSFSDWNSVGGGDSSSPLQRSSTRRVNSMNLGGIQESAGSDAEDSTSQPSAAAQEVNQQQHEEQGDK
jgi:hypothetical protein